MPFRLSDAGICEHYRTGTKTLLLNHFFIELKPFRFVSLCLGSCQPQRLAFQPAEVGEADINTVCWAVFVLFLEPRALLVAAGININRAPCTVQYL